VVPYKIPFNKPFLAGNEFEYIQKAILSGKISGNGDYTKACHQFFKDRFKFERSLLTTSCTDALEMCALLLNLSPGDEVILPSFTFVSTANAFMLRGCTLKFADTLSNIPNISAEATELLITPKTKAIVVVHYAGIACEMEKFQNLAQKYNLCLIEDCAQAVDAYYKEKPLGSFGELSAFSFHETKNIISGEGGMLVVNSQAMFPRAEILWEKGTNRAAYWRGEVDKYTWVDLGSSFLPSELTSAFLFAQLEKLDTIQRKRLAIWGRYFEAFEKPAHEGKFGIVRIPDYATNNAHMFYILCSNLQEREDLINFMKGKGIYLAFHYVPLHSSPFFEGQHNESELPNTRKFSDCLVRLPLYFDLTEAEQEVVISNIEEFYSR
jgi:dTDP-4-amino-4,6-dideoxygalactose transaminase